MSDPVTWRRLGPIRATADEALRGGLEALANAAPDDPATLIWWRVEADTLVLGRGSRILPDEAACRAAGVGLARRASGGGPVLWGPGLLALDLVVPRDHPWFTHDVVDSYRAVGMAFMEGLRGLGVEAACLTPEQARAASSPLGDVACFAGRSAWEVVSPRRKLVGLSQVRRTPGVLVQAGVALTLDLARLGGLLQLSEPQRDALAAEAGAASDELTRLGAEAVIDATEAVLAAWTQAQDPG